MDKEKALKNLYDYVRENNIFYQNLYKNLHGSITGSNMIPILTRKLIREYGDLVISQTFNKTELVHDRTNGTTSKHLDIYKSMNECVQLGVILQKTRMSIDSANYKNLVLCKPKKNETECLNFLQFIEQKSIKWVQCSPSTAYSLGMFLHKYDLKTNIRVLELISEYLPQHYRDFIESVFNCKTFIQYGCHEVWAMGFEDENKKINVMESVIVENEDDDRFTQGYGKCIVTNLIVKSMPFIRYELNDIIKIEEDKTIKTYGYRANDTIYIKDIAIHCSFFDRILHLMINIDFSPLNKYQIVYNTETIYIYVINSYEKLMKLRGDLINLIFQEYGCKVDLQIIKTNNFFIDKNSQKMRAILKQEDCENQFYDKYFK